VLPAWCRGGKHRLGAESSRRSGRCPGPDARARCNKANRQCGVRWYLQGSRQLLTVPRPQPAPGERSYRAQPAEASGGPAAAWKQHRSGLRAAGLAAGPSSHGPALPCPRYSATRPAPSWGPGPGKGPSPRSRPSGMKARGAGTLLPAAGQLCRTGTTDVLLRCKDAV